MKKAISLNRSRHGIPYIRSASTVYDRVRRANKKMIREIKIMFNFAGLTGRLVTDPELRKTKSDISVTSFRIAVARDFVSEGEDDVDFFDIVAWRATAEFICNYFTKGKMITVAGRLKNRKWKDRDDNNRITTELQVENAYFGESRPNGDRQSEKEIDPFVGGQADYSEPSDNAEDAPDSEAVSPFNGTFAEGSQKAPWDM